MQHATVSASLCYEAACMKANDTHERVVAQWIHSRSKFSVCRYVSLPTSGARAAAPSEPNSLPVHSPQSSTKRRCTQS